MSKINSCHQIKKGITPAKGFIVSSNTWGILTLLYCLIFSIRASKTYDVVKHPECYILGICIVKAADCLAASILHPRNWHDLQMVSMAGIAIGGSGNSYLLLREEYFL